MRAQCDAVVRPSRDVWRRVCQLAVTFIVLADGPTRGAAGEPGGGPAPWRRPERDGVNCLYLQLRLIGYTGRYQEVVTAVPAAAERASLDGLARISRRLGFELVPAKLTVAELASLGSPTVILFDEPGLDGGRFHLLLGLSRDHADLVDGTLITRRPLTISLDQFRRGWTGFALVARSRSPWPGRGLGASIGALAVAGVWLTRRSARRRPR
jgi:hypothetical protein